MRDLARFTIHHFAARALAAGLIAAALPTGLTAQTNPPPVPASGPAAPKPVSIGMADARLTNLAGMLSSQAGVTISVFGKIGEERASVLAEEQPLETVLNQVANPKGWVWWREPNGDYGISDREYYEKNILVRNVIQKVYRPNNIKASELDRAIKGLITPNLGSSVADDRTNKLIVNDLAPALERIERFIREIDVQLTVRVFRIKHSDVNDISKKIESYKSGPGKIEVDEKTHLIIVTDLLSNIKQMELIIDILDVGPEIVIYDVNNIGVEGDALEDLKKIIDSVRTKNDDLLFEVNMTQGVFILEDVPEVHERVEQILSGFDQPVKQVLIQAEILSTEFTTTFDLGIRKFALADDLFRASNEGALRGDPLAPLAASAGTAPNYRDLGEVFPNFTGEGDTISGNFLNSKVLLQFRSVFSDSTTRVLLQPRMLVKNQQPSKIFVGSEIPILTTTYDDNTNDNNNSRRTTTQTTVPVGLTFEVTPSISNSYLVELDLSIDNDDGQAQDITDGGETRRVVARDRQQVQTILQVPSGQTRMIGGLISNRDAGTNSGVPFLVSIPVIGYLFGNKATEKTASNLMIFLTPSIVEDVLPRSTTADGRRGRLVTDYERVPGEVDLGLTDETQAEDSLETTTLSAEKLLSGDAAREAAIMKSLDDARAKRESEASAKSVGNYTPIAGSGSASLNATPNASAGGANPGTQQPGQQPRRRGPQGNPRGNRGNRGNDGNPGENNNGMVEENPIRGNETRYK